MAKNEDNWKTFFDELQAYIEAHGHLPDKHVVENRGLLSKAKYLRKKIKAGKAEERMIERFESILAMRSGEHTGGRRRNAAHEDENEDENENAGFDKLNQGAKCDTLAFRMKASDGE